MAFKKQNLKKLKAKYVSKDVKVKKKKVEFDFDHLEPAL